MSKHVQRFEHLFDDNAGEVVDNTAKNTGGATGGPATTDGEPKKSLVEKIKDKVTTKKE